MKYVKADLLSDVVNAYDQTKTTRQGRAIVKTVNSQTVLGPPLNRFVDVANDTAASSQVIPSLSYLSPNGRLFSVGPEVNGFCPISLHTMNMTTGVTSYVGTIRIFIADNAATVQTIRDIKAIDSGVSGWRIFVLTTGSVVINGGLYAANNVDLSDFLAVGPGTLFPSATGSNQKATYFLQDPSNIGVAQLNVTSAGLTLDVANNRAYVHNGISTTHQYYVYSTDAVLNCPLATGLTIDSVTDRVTQTAHGYLNNDPVFITNLVGGTGLLNNGIYFIRNVTANDYQLSLTTGGAIVNITANGTADICRAFGTTGSAWVHKTGNLPALTGTLIASGSEDYAVPGHTANATFPCVFFCTTSNLYLGRLSELTSGATSWPSLVTSNILGTTNQIITPSVAIATWSTVLDKAVYLTNANILVMKQVVNNQIDKIFGRNSNLYRELLPSQDTQGIGGGSFLSLDIEDGWLVLTGNQVGLRGNILADLRSDASFDYSYVVSKVLDTQLASYKFLASWRELADQASALAIYYRTSGFGSITGGWIQIPFAGDLSSIPTANQIQFKIAFNTLVLGASIPAQLREVFLGFESQVGISDNWEFSDELSSNGVPSRTAFRLKKAYASIVPQLFFRAYDLSDALLVNHNTITNVVNFEYSADNGLTWLPLGTVPNVVGTLLRYTFTSPPGVDVRPGIKES